MNAISPADATVGERKIDVSRGECRTDLNQQWQSRRPDERFLTLEDLFASVNARRLTGFEDVIRPRDIDVIAKPDDFVGLSLATKGREIAPTHYSFNQISSLANFKSSELRKLPAYLAGAALQYMLKSRADMPIKLYGDTGSMTARAFTGPEYGRIYDAELVEKIQRFAGTGSRWKVPGQIDWSKMTYNPWVDVTKDSTTLYASDRDVFVFLVDDTHPIEVGKLPNGDPDLVFRGFYAYNSEVGARSAGIASFTLRGICMNRCMWGVENFDHLRIVHSKFAGMRFEREAAPALEHYARSEPTTLLAGITAARQAVVAKNDEERLEFLTKKGNSGLEVSLKAAAHIIEIHEREEGFKPSSVWDFVNGITAVARDIPNQDNRLELENVAAKLMSRAARGAV